MQHPPERRIWSRHVRLPLPEVPLHRTPLSRPHEHFHSRTCLRGRQVSAVQLQWHTTLPRRTAGLPSPRPGVGRLCARDQTRRELFPQRVHRLCHHQARSPRRMRWWTCHTRPPFRPLEGA